MHSRDLFLARARHREARRRFRGPDAVELVVVGAVDPEQRLELAVGDRGIGEIHGVCAVVGVVTGERGDVAVTAAVDQEIVIRDDGRSGDRHILPIGRRDRCRDPQTEPVRSEPRRSVERHDRTEDVGLNRRQPIEERRVPDAFAAARVPDDHDPGQIDLGVERMGGESVPGAELLQCSRWTIAAGVVLTEIGAVEEVDVDGRADDAVRSQQPAEVEITRRGVLERTVIAVGEHRERERPTPARYARCVR